MTRHARNCTAGAVYTYHEKQKDAQASGYGTERLRLGKDSVKDFDCCCLSLQPCQNPVITTDGYLFDKEVILEYIIKKKNEISKQLKEFERQKQKEKDELSLANASKTNAVLQGLVNVQKGFTENPVLGNAGSISNMEGGRDKKLPSFWVPSETPAARSKIVTKPDKTVRCPMSGRPLKLKDLIDVKFTEILDADEGTCTITKKTRYKCAVTGDALNNSVPVAVITTSGDVVTVECVERLIKKDWLHPLSGEKLTESDIILFQRGGTGYATTNDLLNAKSRRPVMQAC